MPHLKLSRQAVTKIQAAIVVAILVIAGVGIGAYYLTLPAPPTTPTTPPGRKDIKVALVMPGSITDMGWDQEPYDALIQAEKDFGITVSYTENVMVTGTPADYDRIIRDYIARGFQFIIAHDFLSKDAVLRAAKDFPKVMFAYDGDVAGKEKGYPNVVAYLPWGHEPSYLAGVLAAKLTKTRVVGVYNGVPIPIEVASVEGFRLGVRSVDPNITVLSTYLGLWHDPKKGHDIVVSMANAGADIVYGVGDGINIGGIEGAKEKGILFIGGTGDQRPAAPGTVLTSVTWGLKSIVYYLIELFVNGKLEGRAYEFTLHTSLAGRHVGPDLVGYSDQLAGRVPADVKALIEQKRADIISGILLVPLVTTPPGA